MTEHDDAASAPDENGRFPSQVDDLLRAGRKIEAIKLLRQLQGLDLRDAKSAAERRAVELGIQSKPSPCFVATVAFGGPFEREVCALRRLRDERLVLSAPGRLFIRAYNRFGPVLAEWIQPRPAARVACRYLLRPLARLVDRVSDPGRRSS